MDVINNINPERSITFRVLFGIKKPRKCRVLLGFEPASAGGPRPRNAALAQAYRVVPVRWKPLMWMLAQNESAISRTPQGEKLIP